MRKVLFLATMLAFIMTSSAWAADLSGTWTIKITKIDGGDDSFDVAIKDTGGNLTITGTHGQLGPLSGNGAVKGDDVNMSVKATGQMPVEFILAGKIAGNKISGTREIKVTGGGEGGGAPAGGGQSASGGQAGGGQGGQGAPGGQTPAGGDQGSQGSATGQVSNTFTAEKK
jgi:hypothetical protein